MSSIVIIGNSESFTDQQGRMVTPRGYSRKFESSSSNRMKAERARNPGAVMFCGTASDVGKSVLTAGFCRYLVNIGIKVAPFKSQNMSLNSFVTPEGGELGRAQATQAQACKIPPHTDMNPVLLKPNSDTGSQVVVQGRAVGNMNVREYDAHKPQLIPKVQESFDRLKNLHDFIVLEGAGSISEINLRDKDIANLKMAAMAECPVILVADIDRGGVFAQIIGTIELLEPFERSCIKGIIINKFRGDISILTPGIQFIEERTGIPLLGVLPWFPDLRLPDEDSVALARHLKTATPAHNANVIRIGVVRLPRISNFTDLDALQTEPDVILSYLENVEQLEKLDLLILPGSKSTISDLTYLKERGWFEALKDFKGRIIGICGGYQMLGRGVSDPDGVESRIKEAAAIGLLSVETTLRSNKETHQVTAQLLTSAVAFAQGDEENFTGYEIHMGHTVPVGRNNPFARIIQRGENPVNVEDGFVSPDNRIIGTYIHGIFDNDSFRTAYLDEIRCEKGLELQCNRIKSCVTDPFDLLADHLEKHLDMPRLLNICGLDSDCP
jgi:adenosylcobyric acid synthase